MRTSWWSHLEDRFEVILNGFWKSSGRIFGDFGVMFSSKVVLEALRELGWGWKLIFWVRLRPFWRVLESFWEAFSRYFGIFCRYKCHHGLWYDFQMIFHWSSYPTDKQKWANYMGGPAKTKLSSCLLSNVFVNWFWKDFGLRSEAILSSNWPSKPSVIKYTNEEGPRSISNPPPSKIFNLGAQCERETGRASQADVTPYGVGGFWVKNQNRDVVGSVFNRDLI